MRHLDIGHVALGLTVCMAVSCTKKSGGSNESTVDGPRMVILGFDGVDPRRLDTLVAAGKLPNVEALGAEGHRGSLRSTNPPQSPVAWAAFASGLPTGEHGIFDFIGRDPRTYVPKIATTRVTHASINGKQVMPAEAENLRRGDAFWDVIARGGVAVRTHTVPYSFPPPPGGARSLAGLGTPDIRGINSSYTLLTDDKTRAGKTPPAGGQIAILEPMADGGWRAMVQGPRITHDGNRKKTQAPVVVRPKGDALQIDIGGQRQVIAVGETGDYVTLRFVPSPLLTIQAATRVTVRKGAPNPELYVEPLSIHPSAQYLPLSVPATLAQGLWERIGAFKTVGWAHDTSALGGGAMDEEQFLAEAFTTMRWREKALLAALRNRYDTLTIAVFTAPDRIGHMFYRYIDPKHPAHDENAPPAMTQALDKSYLEMDRIIGAVRKLLDAEDTLVIISDHGFASFRRGLNLNTWLRRQGYLTVKSGVKKPRDFFLDVDWASTKAYALGTGSIFINQRGRESRGIVSPATAGALAREIAGKLRSIRDGKTPVVLAAYVGDDVFAGARRRDAPDVRVGMAKGYRASWATTLGGIPKTLFDDNTRKWSGDHSSARPEDVPGILISNRAVTVADPRLEDLSATAFAFTGVRGPAGTIGRPLFAPGGS